MILAQAEVVIPIWLVAIVIGVPTFIVSASTIFNNQRKMVKTQAKALIHEMVVTGALPSATKQQRVIGAVAKIELQMAEVTRAVEVMALTQRKQNGDVEALTVAQAATDAKVTLLMDHFGLSS